MSRLSALRRGAAKAAGRKGKSKGGFYAQWKPPSLEGKHGLLPDMTPQETMSEVQAAEPIIFIPGAYQDHENLHPITQQPSAVEMYRRYAHKYQHYFKGKPAGWRDITCTRGSDSHNPQHCFGCLLIDQREWNEDTNGARGGWVANLAHLTKYVELDYKKDGVVQMQKNDPTKPIRIRKECKQGTISNRIYWRRRQAESSQRSISTLCDGCIGQCMNPGVFGCHRFWEMGKNHFDSIMDFNNNVLGKICFYTGTGIMKKGFYCGNCGNYLLDLASSQLTNKDIEDFEDKPQPCPHCHHHDYPVADYEAGLDAGGMARVSGFQHPIDPSTGQPVRLRPLDIFDVVLWVQREGEKTKSIPIVKKWARITEAPFGEGGAPMDLTQVVEALVPKPFDFDDLFAMSTKEQAEKLGRPDPYASQAQQSYGQPTTAYGGPPTVPPPQPPQAGYAPQPAPAAPPQPAIPVAAPTAPYPAPAPAAPVPAIPTAAQPAIPAPAPMAAPPPPAPPPPPGQMPAAPIAPALPIPAPATGAPAAPPTTPAPIAAPYPQAPAVGTPAASPPQPGNRPDYSGNK